MSIKASPGECPICGAAHTMCTADSGPIAVTQLPARDEATTQVSESFSTGTYRRKPKPKP